MHAHTLNFSPFTNLLLRALCMNHINVDALVHQLVEQLPGSLYGLHEHQHGGHKALHRGDEKRHEGL